MARRSGGPGITLFSFQDIITSVSGIMIFVTLILALELLDKTQNGGASAAATRDAQDLKKRIDAARSDRDALKRRALADSRSSGRSSLADERAANEAEERVQLAERELEVIDRRSISAHQREEEAKTRKTAVEAATRSANEEKALEIKSLGEKLAAAEKGDLIYFNLEANPAAKRDGWLALVDSRGVTVAPFGRPAAPRTFAGSLPAADELDTASRAFVEWAAREVPQSYILLVVRPGGSLRLDPIEQALTAAHRSFGLDLVTESQEVMDSVTGVYRP